MSVNTRFQIPQRGKKKSHVERSGERGGPRHVSETGNEVPGKRVSNNAHCQVSIATEVANPEEKNADHLAPLGRPTEYYPFKRCQVPVGHSVQPHIDVMASILFVNINGIPVMYAVF